MTSSLSPDSDRQPVFSSLKRYLQEFYVQFVLVPPVELASPPFRFTDREMREIQITADSEKWFTSLIGMYESFDPTQRAQGLPPDRGPAIKNWLDDVRQGLSVVAVHDDAVVGHVMFVLDETGGHELGIFVHQDYQRAGIGTQLLRAGLGRAREDGLSDVWLSVERSNPRAQKLYRRMGFRAEIPTGVCVRMSRKL